MKKAQALILFLAILSSCTTKDIKSDKSQDSSQKGLSMNVDEKPYRKSEDYHHVSSLEQKASFALVSLDKLKDLESEDYITQLFLHCYKDEFQVAQSKMREHGRKYFNWPSYWQVVGFCYQKKNEERKAILYYNKASELSKNYPPASNNLSMIFFNQKLREKALKSLQMPINGDSYFISKLNYLRLLISFNLISEAKKVAATMRENQELYRRELAYIQLFSGDYEEARDLYSELADHEFDKVYVKINYALSLSLTGQKEKAQELLSSLSGVRLNKEEKEYLESAQGVIQ